MVLDGAMGTMIMKKGLTEEDFRGSRFQFHDKNLKGCNDVLSLTRPDIISEIHKAYLEAGADIIETNSFNSNYFSLKDYSLEDLVGEIAGASARIARAVADNYTEQTGRRIWIAGSMGPTSKSLTMAFQTGDDTVSYEQMEATYSEAAEALMINGVDMIFLETVFDTLNLKSAASGIRKAIERTGITVPVAVSITLTETGRTLSGMTPEGMLAAIEHISPFAFMLNCGFGVDGMVEPLKKFGDVSCLAGIYPNAGLPDAMGEYNETAQAMASKVKVLLEKKMLNIVGGCCGTTPAHIAELAKIINASRESEYVRPVPKDRETLKVSGLKPFEIENAGGFVMVGERCNVAGSRKFLRLIKEKKLDEALDIAAAQVEAGAGIIDVNLDDAMLDAQTEMTGFLRALTADSRLADVPVMIDSADFKVLETALKVLQGRSIVNSISLKGGEKLFREHAKRIRELGGVPVIMAFDEKGQATDLERRKEIFSRSFDILTSREVGFKAHELIFDPNILAVCTGIEGHDILARDFVESVKWIKSTFPGVKVSGGLSNLSFAFRGNNTVREAMHALFLKHAVKAGMDMAIVNPSTMMKPDDIDPQLATAIENALFENPSSDSTARLVEIATEILQKQSALKSEKDNGAKMSSVKPDDEVPTSAGDRLREKIVRAESEGLKQCIDICLDQGMKAIDIVDGPLMAGMNKVGELFGAGKLFLPQVVKSATVMKNAVEILTPVIKKENVGCTEKVRKKLVLATVKGDVHDIGKNIVGIIMQCNNWDVIDLGVMVEPDKILDTALKMKADAIGLSGLITPSLQEMSVIAELMEQKGMTIPLFVGGATTSQQHTAVKIAPLYESGVVAHTSEAASLPGVAALLTGPEAESRRKEIKEVQAALRAEYEKGKEGERLLSGEEARSMKQVTHTPSPKPVKNYEKGEVPVEDLRNLINWRAFLDAWDLPPSLAESIKGAKMPCNCGVSHAPLTDFDVSAKEKEAYKLLKDAEAMLEFLKEKNCTVRYIVKILPVTTENEDIIVETEKGKVRIHAPRQQRPNLSGRPQLSLSDFLVETGDYMGVFAVTSKGVITDIIETLKRSGDEYHALLMQTLADRLAEAATEYLHKKVKDEIWGLSYQGIRPAVGYPSLPDQKVIFTLDKILDYNSFGVELTENGAMNPPASTTGLFFGSPDARYFAV